jgi:hypothetical protein
MSAKALKDDYVRQFLQHLRSLDDAIDKFTQKSFDLIFEYSSESVSSCWTDCTEEFIAYRTMHYSQRAKSELTMNSSIGHPAKVEELLRVKTNTQSLTEEMEKMIQKLKKSTTIRLEELSLDFVCYLQFFMQKVTAVYNNRLMDGSSQQHRDVTLPITKDCPFSTICDLLEGNAHVI